MLSENTKWMIFGILLAAGLILVTVIGSSVEALSSMDYKLEIWALILVFIAFLVAYIFKKSGVVVNVPDKAIKVYVDVSPVGVVNATAASYGQPRELEQKEKSIVEIIAGKTQPWANADVGEVSLDGEEIK
jgi:hypothetical protein